MWVHTAHNSYLTLDKNKKPQKDDRPRLVVVQMILPIMCIVSARPRDAVEPLMILGIRAKPGNHPKLSKECLWVLTASLIVSICRHHQLVFQSRLEKRLQNLSRVIAIPSNRKWVHTMSSTWVMNIVFSISVVIFDGPSASRTLNAPDECTTQPR